MALAEPRLLIDLAEADGRYDRQERISWWDQQRLAQASALVVGAGALGNELVKNLALLGVGTIAVVDLDYVENSNLSRCVLFRELDEGQAKAPVASLRAAELNPEVRIVPIVGDVRHSIGLGLIREFDVVLGGLDSREARVHVNQACWKAGTPWVDGAIEGLMGIARAFVPPDSACYECTMSPRDYKLLANRRACSLLTREQMLSGKVPTTVTSASVTAAIQVQEAVKLLHRDVLPYEFAGKGYLFNGATHDSYVVDYPRRSDCFGHDVYDEWTPVSAEIGLGDLLSRAQADLGEEAVLDLELDIVVKLACRTCDEVEAVRAPAASVNASKALCPTCGGDRFVDLIHTVTTGDRELLSLTPAELGVPSFDVITGRAGQRRRFYRIGFGSPLEEIAHAS